MGRKWNNIKYGKAAKDANKSKIYAKFGKEIYVAAKGEPDPEINRNLKMVIDKAKTYGVPKDIINRAIEKAAGGAEEDYVSLRYEGYGPGGSAIIVDCLSDNVNRTVAEVRSTFKKKDGSMGVSGSVSFLFEHVALFVTDKIDEDTVFETLLDNDCDAKEITTTEDGVMVIAAADQFHKIQDAFKKSNDIEEFMVSELTMMPFDQIDLDGENLEKFEILIEALEDLEDVQSVYHNINL